jgi:hypothetical protein
MRFIFLIVSALVLSQCATREDRRFRVGASDDAYIVINIAKAEHEDRPHYSMFWRQLDARGEFAEFDGDRTIDIETNEGGTVRVRGIPGEFLLARVDPGVYALDSVFAVIRENNVDYVANGVVAGPERPSFEVRAGEAVYLGIWEVDIEDNNAVARPWRLDAADLRAVMRAADEEVAGEVRVRETMTRAVACTPHRINNLTQRQVC